ncbi:MAG TPA: exodeoxyribonuclease VII large subunit, partial [Candidatus Omnitrophota bacterium]|nr:exodeoxyribonuclease VII large subunit [Candidatus Omnitrophota bacterium]
DFVADLRAPTPSAAAELVIPRKEDLSTAVGSAVTRLKHALIAKIDILEERVKALSDSYILRQPLNVIEQHEQRIDDLRKDLADRMAHVVDMRGENFRLLAGKLGTLNPLAILNRGYSITTNWSDGVIVKDASKLKEGDKVETKLANGKFVGRVESVG